jgi:uroporphyrinogen-III decarboxylase
MDPIALPIYETLLNNDPFNLRVPDLDTEMRFLFEEIDLLLDAGFKKTQIGLPDMQGPLNIAMRLIGDKKMISLIARPNKEKEVRHILNVTKDTYIQSIKALRRALGKPENGHISVSGCTHYYIAPKHWLIYIKPIMHELETHFGDLRLHHCGEANHERLDAYNQVQFREVEFGFGTDIKYAREKYIHPKLGPIHISCRISPYRMLNQTSEIIKQDVEYLLSAGRGGPMNISVVGAPYNTPDENIYALWNTVQKYNIEKAENEE